MSNGSRPSFSEIPTFHTIFTLRRVQAVRSRSAAQSDDQGLRGPGTSIWCFVRMCRRRSAIKSRSKAAAFYCKQESMIAQHEVMYVLWSRTGDPVITDVRLVLRATAKTAACDSFFLGHATRCDCKSGRGPYQREPMGRVLPTSLKFDDRPLLQLVGLIEDDGVHIHHGSTGVIMGRNAEPVTAVGAD